MIFIADKPVIYCDIDDTLVLWNEHITEENQHLVLIGIHETLLPHKPHIELLKQFKARGHTVVVWSQGGSEWARTIVQTLKLEEYVDIVMPKPYWFIDDLPASIFMNESARIWLDPNYTKKTIKPTGNFEVNE